VTRALLNGAHVPTTHGDQRRDFLHVSDVAGAFAALVDGQPSGAVNIAAGKAVAIREILELIEKATGKHDAIQYGALPMRTGEPDAIVGDSRRLREEFGFRPRIGLKTGIDETVAWWQQQAIGG
jgi:nucleoside-diphosphate-sugar epimerase